MFSEKDFSQPCKVTYYILTVVSVSTKVSNLKLPLRLRVFVCVIRITHKNHPTIQQQQSCSSQSTRQL